MAAAQELDRKQLLLPMLEILAQNGGELRPAEVVEAIAARFQVPDSVMDDYTFVPDWNKRYNPFVQKIHWTRMDGVLDGYLERKQRGVWTLSEKGYDALQMCAPGVIFTIYETALGKALWAEAETAAGYLKDDSVNLLFTSPPYPLEVGKKDYGNKTGRFYIEWLTDLATEWKRTLTDDGSMVINLADAWHRGSATRNLYIERLLINLVDDVGLFLADRAFWECPNKIPASHWTTVKRVRLNHSVEHLLWLSKSESPKANNRNVLEPYKCPDKMEAMRSRVTQRGAAGHLTSKKAFHADNGGRIPHSVLQMANASSSDRAFSEACKKAGIVPHPARMPPGLPEFWIKFLTNLNDHVHDPFLGSGITAQAAEKLGRRWSGSEKSMEYIRGQFKRMSLCGASPMLA